MSHSALAERVQAVRRFSRFYTSRIGVLHEGFLGSALTLTEARVIYELAQLGPTTATRLGTELSLDSGYLSRLLRSFESKGLLGRRGCETDARQSILSLTQAGREVYEAINARSEAEVGAVLRRLSAAEQDRLVSALRTAEALLGGEDAPARGAPYLLRPPRPGDFGWVVHRQGALYAQEYGWDEQFEAMVARIVAQFVETFDRKREACWIAEREGAVVGSVFLVRQSDDIAKLRLLYVEPAARGLGIGRRLVDECIRFARQTGYREITLWTNDVLVAARRIYAQAGFRLVQEERHHSFGHDLVGENWTMELRS